MCLLVPQHDVACLQTHADELLRLLQQLAGKDNDEVGGVAHLSLLLLAGHDEQLCGGVDNLELPQYCCSVRGEDHLLEVVDDDLVASKGTQRGLDSLGNRPAGIDVANDGAILSVVAVRGVVSSVNLSMVGQQALTSGSPA